MAWMGCTTTSTGSPTRRTSPRRFSGSSLYSIADMFNYVPRRAIPAQVYLTFYNATQADGDQPPPPAPACRRASPVQSGAVLKNFEVQYDVRSRQPARPPPRAGDAGAVLAVEGRTYTDETIGISNGFVGQKFFLPRTSVLEDTIQITTQMGEVTRRGRRFAPFRTMPIRRTGCSR